MTARVAINGLGRLGRAVLRISAVDGSGVDVVAINDTGDLAALARLVRRDDVHGTFEGTVDEVDEAVVVNGSPVELSAERDARRLPWKDLGVDIVLECTGRVATRAGAARHLTAGARAVVVSQPVRDADVTLAPGINDAAYDAARHRVISGASCTTHCGALLATVLHDTAGIRHGSVLAVHASPADLHDVAPRSSSAARTIGLVLPQLAGRLSAHALHVPVAAGSLVQLVVESERQTSADELNAAFAARAAGGPLAGLLAYSETALVSSGVVGNRASCVVDATLTTVVDDTHVDVVGWYDAEWAYASRLVDLCRLLAGTPGDQRTAPRAARA